MGIRMSTKKKTVHKIALKSVVNATSGRAVNSATAKSMFVKLPDPPPFDPVNHPEHYAAGEIECIDAIRVALGKEAFIAYCRGMGIKYSWRADKKGQQAQDLRKAAWYLTHAAGILEVKG